MDDNYDWWDYDENDGDLSDDEYPQDDDDIVARTIAGMPEFEFTIKYGDADDGLPDVINQFFGITRVMVELAVEHPYPVTDNVGYFSLN